jgi:hypothetical protein
LATRNPGANEDASQNMSAFTINVKRPNVRIFTGSVRSNRRGRTSAFTIPITIAATNAAGKLWTVTPGTRRVTTRTAKAFKNKRTSNNIEKEA